MQHSPLPPSLTVTRRRRRCSCSPPRGHSPPRTLGLGNRLENSDVRPERSHFLSSIRSMMKRRRRVRRNSDIHPSPVASSSYSKTIVPNVRFTHTTVTARRGARVDDRDRRMVQWARVRKCGTTACSSRRSRAAASAQFGRINKPLNHTDEENILRSWRRHLWTKFAPKSRVM